MNMLDAGINIPEMINMVFFKSVQSKVKILNTLMKILNLFYENDIDKLFNNIDSAHDKKSAPTNFHGFGG